MSKTSTVVRDFVYLDWERVRSMSAQLLGGVPQDATRESGHDAGARGQVEGGIPLAIKGRGEGDYRYFRTQNETRSLHHYVYSLFEERLRARGAVAEVDSGFDFGGWREDRFRDGQFVRATGLVRLMDYGWLSTMMEALPNMMGAAHHAANIGLKQARDEGRLTRKEFDAEQRKQQRQLTELKALKLEKITELVKRLYGDAVRVKVVPDPRRAANAFVGSANLACFHDSAASLAQKYGYEIDAGWTVLGQVNLSSATATPTPIPTGNDMEDAFEAAALGINNIVRVASATRFPAVSFTPISIYRTC
ncbi:MAG: hypothetical protein M3R38_09495 [Actinomycetota bacterium]|nr:hypothetical protein [Actinomycetota bacterium]